MKLPKRSQGFVDISLSFEPNPTTQDITLLKNERSINNSIKNLIMIAPTEVPFQSDVGSHVRNSLFELVDGGTPVLLEEEIRRSIRYSEPRVELKDVFVSPDIDTNGINVTVKYIIVGTELEETVSHLLKPTD